MAETERRDASQLGQPADEASEKRWQLICQNRAFTYMLPFGLEGKPQPVLPRPCG